MIVYCARNKINGNEYIGATYKPLKERWKNHLWKSRNFSKIPLHLALNEFGSENFELYILGEYESKDDMDAAERIFIAERKPLYNVTPGGAGGRGVKLTSEHKEKIGRGSKRAWDTSSDRDRRINHIRSLGSSRERAASHSEKMREHYKRNPEAREKKTQHLKILTSDPIWKEAQSKRVKAWWASKRSGKEG